MSGDNLPFISCKCITYGRVSMLEESLHSFLQQDYPKDKCEMVIVNDYPLQTLKFDHPQVKIYNLNQTFPTIGAKENFATELCNGEIVCQWDDDDVAMPWHLQNVAEWFKENTKTLHWGRGVYFNEPNITSIEFIGNSGMAFSKTAWNSVGGHPNENAGYDTTFMHSIHKKNKSAPTIAMVPVEKTSWFYMWGGRGYHQSGMGTDVPGRPDVIKRHSQYIEDLRRKGMIPTGDIQLSPSWKRDYKELLEEYVRRVYNTDLSQTRPA